ncbi:Salutaridine reductase-like [Zea mays]|uniref:(+)-neomenthol dehydrogenase n=1 Tax=Zea mays TaxID=4577 RepID=B4FSX7_MAIZE|nr:Salutaridine reductase-like [Zea mays]ACF85220.1 unknown [Zea mays]ACF85535.1 unknown [Zea mays]ACG27634.1 carbonyl reductase 1 [Zea mays]AQK73040.1 (+)-neomenthol dehydrogenase [Zea mays]|eukprot:NP_001147467.1 uncharacterized protein LOC100281076 [Zea mays]
MEGGAVPKPSEKRVALVTGGNRGMGFEICRQLASSGLTVVLTARSETRGAEAARELHGFGLPDVVSHQLDVTEPTSAARLADFVRTKFGKLDVLVNNAGIMGVTMEVGDDEAAVKEMMVGKDQNEIAEWLKQRTTQSAEQAEECVRINYHGTKTVTEALLPLVQSSSSSSSGGRIVNVTSSFGLLRFFSGEELRQELSSVDTLTTQRLDELSALFLEDYRSGRLEPRGWPTDRVYAAYQVSKALVSAYARVLARDNPALRVNCVHPGYVQTEMNRNTGDLTAAEGARVSVAVALADQGGVTGAYFDRTQIASFV